MSFCHHRQDKWTLTSYIDEYYAFPKIPQFPACCFLLLHQNASSLVLAYQKSYFVYCAAISNYIILKNILLYITQRYIRDNNSILDGRSPVHANYWIFQIWNKASSWIYMLRRNVFYRIMEEWYTLTAIPRIWYLDERNES